MGKQVKEYMQDASGITVNVDMLMIEVLKKMIEQKSPVVVVTDAVRTLEGIITGSDVIRELEKDVDSSVLRDGVAKHVMTPRPFFVAGDTLMIDAVDKMFRMRLHYLVVTGEYEPVGILTQLGVVKWWLEEYLPT